MIAQIQMPRHVFAIAACCGLALLSTTAAAAPRPTIDVTIGAATDYVFRGVSQTEGRPEVFGSVDLTLGGAYAGVSGENVRFAGDAAAALFRISAKGQERVRAA